ncbi:hypothetical protein OG21DRAFT_1505649 [Imleria badia]|nr:hypothetical protein OG21DRAFT_1505649 [Imleria badia]
MRAFAFAPALLLVNIGFVTVAAATIPTTNSVTTQIQPLSNQLTPAVKSDTPDDDTTSGIVDKTDAVVRPLIRNFTHAG